MESLVTSALLSFSTNIDNLAVGTAYGFKRLTIGIPANLLIASLSGVSTYTSMSLGDWVNDFCSPVWAQHLGSAILILVGLYTLWDLLKNTSLANSAKIDTETVCYGLKSGKSLSLKEAWMLGLALTVSNLGTGIGAGIADLDWGVTSSFSFLSSLVMIGGGALVGKRLMAQFSEHQLSLFSGILLISLGIYEAF